MRARWLGAGWSLVVLASLATLMPHSHADPSYVSNSLVPTRAERERERERERKRERERRESEGEREREERTLISCHVAT